MAELFIILLAIAFSVLVFTFASASRLAGYVRPYIGISLLIAPIVTFLLDFTVWAIAESLMTILFFLFYPSDQLREILAPLVVLAGCMVTVLALIGLPFASLLFSILELIPMFTDLASPSVRLIFSASITVLSAIVGMFIAYRGLLHLGPKMRMAVRVLGQNV